MSARLEVGEPPLERRVENLERWRTEAESEARTAARILAVGFLVIVTAELVEWIWC